MANRTFARLRGKQRGVAAVEMAIVTVLLIMLAVPVFYLMWNIHTQTLLTNTAREVANLVARPAGFTAAKSMQDRIKAVAAASLPLQLARYGNIYVTEVQRDGSCSSSQCSGMVVGKWRWNDGHGTALSNPGFGVCHGAWGAGGDCGGLPSAPLRVPYGLVGKHVFIVEVYYRDPAGGDIALFNVPEFNREALHATAIF